MIIASTLGYPKAESTRNPRTLEILLEEKEYLKN